MTEDGCEFCGRRLPARKGRGRRQRYCDATCRSAGRRRRERGLVNEVLTAPEGRATLGPATELSAVATAQQALRAAEADVRSCVEHARASGHTWQEVGVVLGISRQAAFQRFGRPVDARGGSGWEAIVVTDAEDRAVVVVGDLMAGQFDAVRSGFDERMAEAVDAIGLADVCAQLSATIGRYEGAGTPFARQLGGLSVVDVPLRFEAGEATAQVSFRADARIAGLYLRPSEAG